LKKYFGFRTHCKVLLRVLNHAVDLIDEASGISDTSRRRQGHLATSYNTNLITSLNSNDQHFLSPPSNINTLETNNYEEENNTLEQGQGDTSEEENEWFYHKDFAFYSLKVESKYPWMRSTGVFSILLTFAFYFFTPILWCSILNDTNICPTQYYGYNNNEEEDNYRGWMSALFFASATMSTVGYGDVTVLFNSGNDVNIDDAPEPPGSWRIFIATIYMILSLVVSIVGFGAGLDSKFHPFRQRFDIFGKRVFEVLRDANLVKGKHDTHEEIVSRMRLSKISQLAEITIIFLLLNLIGVFAVQLSLLTEKEDKYGNKLSISWMESFYWSVQTTTTIGYGDVAIPESLRWFLLLYLALSTYFVGSAFGKLGMLSEKIQSMQMLYTWEQQEASYTMLHDFSGRPNESNDSEGRREDVEPEIDQFEFTIASLVVMGKITSDDVRPILEKFKRLTGEKSNKITSADVSGPIRKKAGDIPESDEVVDVKDKVHAHTPGRSLRNPSMLGKIAQAFKEEVLTSDRYVTFEEEGDKPDDYSDFHIPQNTHAIAIDDSKIQRKLLSKIFENVGISSERCTICGDGYTEIMGFEDYVVTFMGNNDGYVLMIVDENLDFVDEATNKHDTISGSQCVENIRRRLLPENERRMFALIRSANDSSSDVAIYNTRAHGFLAKAPIKRDKMKETLAPMWLERFPPSEFGDSTSGTDYDTQSGTETTVTHDSAIGCTPYDVAHLLSDIDLLFQEDVYISEPRMIQDKIHELKGDLLTMHSTLPVHSLVGQINLILSTQAPETLLERWTTVRDNTNVIIQSLQKQFRLPSNTYAIAIDDSKIQRKLLGKFFGFLSIPEEQCTIMGDGSAEILGFEDFVVDFMADHKEDYVLMVVDENLDTVDATTNDSIFVSGSQCVDNIRKRLPTELEKRMLAMVRSANDSTTDILVYQQRAHGFLPKAPLRREKVNETIAPIWMKRFPASDFVDSAAFDSTDETISAHQSNDLGATPFDIAQKLVDIEGLFKKEVHISDMRLINDQLHELKGDLLCVTESGASIISSLGMINLMLLGHSMGQRTNPDAVLTKWHNLRDHIYDVINSMENSNEGASPLHRKKSLLSRMMTS